MGRIRWPFAPLFPHCSSLGSSPLSCSVCCVGLVLEVSLWDLGAVVGQIGCSQESSDRFFSASRWIFNTRKVSAGVCHTSYFTTGWRVSAMREVCDVSSSHVLVHKYSFCMPVLGGVGRMAC